MKGFRQGFYALCFSLFLALPTAANAQAAGEQDETAKRKSLANEAPMGKAATQPRDGSPLYKSPEETPSSEISSTPSGEEFADPPRIENEEEIMVEEDGADKKKNPLDTALDFYQDSQELWSQGEIEEAINALDEAYSFILNVNSGDDPAMIQQKEDLRILISRRIIEIYASRYTAVDGSHQAIPLTMNEHVEYEIKQFQTVERNFFLSSYKRSGKYLGKIIKELKEAGIPEELAWLPLVESGFHVRALSPARALGLWQFIPSTGYKFGLQRDGWIDERLDPEKSTKAAIAYLQELHRMFGDWTTVLAAYNSGEGNVLQVIRGQKTNYLDNFWDLYKRLPRETARYVPRFLATLHILKEPGKYGFDLGETEEPLSFEAVPINKQVSLDAIAKELGVSGALLSDFNPELRLKVTPPVPYSLRIPPAMADSLLARLDGIPPWSPARTRPAKSRHRGSAEGSYVYRTVRKGETLSAIAIRYKTTVPAILKANHLQNGDFIKAGQRLKIPLSGGKGWSSP